jgi:hypothetical protein
MNFFNKTSLKFFAGFLFIVFLGLATLYFADKLNGESLNIKAWLGR